MTYINQYLSPIGKIIMASDGINLTGLWFEDQKYFNNNIYSMSEFKNLPVFDLTKKWLDIYFEKKIPDFTPPILAKSTPFRENVWAALLDIPYGEVLTYGKLAKIVGAKMGKCKMSAQAIGGAVGHNPVSIIVPCHRIIGADGSLTGYAGGIEKKIYLLQNESIDISKLYTPKKGTAL